MGDRARWSLTTDEELSATTLARTEGPMQVFGDAVGRAADVGREYTKRWQGVPQGEPDPYEDGEQVMQTLVAYLVTGLAAWDICMEPGPLTQDAARSLYARLLGFVARTREKQAGVFLAAGAREVLRGLDRDLWALRGLAGESEGSALGRMGSSDLLATEAWLQEQWEADSERAEACS